MNQLIQSINQNPVVKDDRGYNASTPERDRFIREFHSLYWELHTMSMLIELGFELENYERPGGKGPDVLVNLDGKKIWIECIAPTPGTGPDAVPEMPFNRIGDKRSTAHSVPIDEITLRITTAFDAKTKKFKEYIDDGIVQPDDVKIVAINGASAWFGNPDFDGLPPLALKCLYGLGQMLIPIDRGDDGVRVLQMKKEIKKSGGDPVPNRFFLLPEYECISGLLYSRANASNYRVPIVDSAYLVPNLFADAPCPEAFLNSFHSYRPELRILDVKRSNER